MKGLENQTYLVGYIISNIVGLFLLLAAIKWPRLARFLFFLLFTWAGITNWVTALRNPDVYLEYADLSPLKIYEQIIKGWFSKHILAIVGTIACCQLLIGFGMLLRKWPLQLACIGGMLFLLAIAPLGVGSAFPATVLMAVALYLLLRKKDHDLIWLKRRSNTANL